MAQIGRSIAAECVPTALLSALLSFRCVTPTVRVTTFLSRPFG